MRTTCRSGLSLLPLLIAFSNQSHDFVDTAPIRLHNKIEIIRIADIDTIIVEVAFVSALALLLDAHDRFHNGGSLFLIAKALGNVLVDTLNGNVHIDCQVDFKAIMYPIIA